MYRLSLSLSLIRPVIPYHALEPCRFHPSCFSLVLVLPFPRFSPSIQKLPLGAQLVRHFTARESETCVLCLDGETDSTTKLKDYHQRKKANRNNQYLRPHPESEPITPLIFPPLPTTSNPSPGHEPSTVTESTASSIHLYSRHRYHLVVC